jgi:hypothetical protein
MSPKIKTIDDCRTPSEFIEYAEQSGKAQVYRKGKYAKIRGNNGSVAEMYENTTDLPKCAREVFTSWFKVLGIVSLLLVIGLGYLAVTHPAIVGAAIGKIFG